jgi:Collagen triple helix repeat (20 copies)
MPAQWPNGPVGATLTVGSVTWVCASAADPANGIAAAWNIQTDAVSIGGGGVQVVGTGATGAKGDKGDKGDTGGTGAPGTNGTNGINGTNGADGLPGVNGGVGAKGDTGQQGTVGPTGAKGDTGSQGATGPQGPIGPAQINVVNGTSDPNTYVCGITSSVVAGVATITLQRGTMPTQPSGGGGGGA